MATAKGPVFEVEADADRRRAIGTLWISSLVITLFLLFLGFAVRFDGKPHHDWQQFLGRFHPLVVHLPIGLLVLVPVLEIAGEKRAALREAAHFVLSLSFFACLLSVVLGFLLAYGGGSMGAGVTRHMWGGIALTIAVLACTLLRPHPAYPWLLTGVMLLLVWTAHQGGALTHGDHYLTEYLPRPLKVMFTPRGGKAQAPQFPDSFYARHIYPVLDKKCVSCHGEEEVKGHLRLDSYDLLMQGGVDGAVIIPGHPERSILMQRVTLPSSDKKFMPSEGKPPLTPDEISWIRAWIAQGASPEVKKLAGITVYEPEPPPPPVPDYRALLGRISQVGKAGGVTLEPLSRNLGDGLILNTTAAGAKFGDAQLAALNEFAPYIVEVNLARTSVTDAGLATLGKFPNLRAIHLDGTAINGSGLQQLTHLHELRYLNLSETQVTQASLAPLSRMKSLTHLYLFDTPAQRKQP